MAWKNLVPVVLVALLGAGSAFASGAVKLDPCVEQGQAATKKCQAECWQGDPNQKDTDPKKKDVQCMKACPKRGDKATKECFAKKAAGGGKKNQDEIPTE